MTKHAEEPDVRDVPEQAARRPPVAPAGSSPHPDTRRPGAGVAERALAVTEALGRTMTSAELARAAVQVGVAELGAVAGFFAVASAFTGPDDVAVVASEGYPTATVDNLDSWIPRDLPNPVRDAIQSGTSVLMADALERARFYPHLEDGRAAMGFQAVAVLPLLVDGNAVGAVAFHFPDPHVFGAEERALLGAFAGQCAQAFERARLYDAETTARREAEEARAEAEAARERAAFLAQAGLLLGSALDVEKTLHQIARLAVPELADGCGIDVIGPEGIALVVTVVPSDPMHPSWPGVLHAARDDVLRNVQPVLIGPASSEGGEGGDLAAALAALGVHSAIFAPVPAREGCVGTLTLLATRPDRRFGRGEVDLAVQLGRRIGLAVEAARLYAAERQARNAAEQSADRLSRLQALTGALSAALTLDEVAAVVVELGGLSLAAHTSALWVPDATVEVLELVRSWGAGRARAEARPRVGLDTKSAIGDSFHTGQPTYFESMDEYAARYPPPRRSPMSAG
jgi:GAF domain-containing protein